MLAGRMQWLLYYHKWQTQWTVTVANCLNCHHAWQLCHVTCDTDHNDFISRLLLLLYMVKYVPKKCPFPWGNVPIMWTHTKYEVPWVHHSWHPALHFEWLSRFCKARGCDHHTDMQNYRDCRMVSGVSSSLCLFFTFQVSCTPAYV